jgi:hypothetical protein
MLGQVSVRHILILVCILIMLVGINRISPYSIADEFAQRQRHLPTIRQLFRAHMHLFIDTFNDVMAIIETIKEFEKLGIGFGAQLLVCIIGW